MKIVGIFRGFPGLGRVVSGVELLRYFNTILGSEIFIYSYLQGEELLNQYNIQNQFLVSGLDISSIGIIPVSKFGEAILSKIGSINPDFVLIDGEPLMVQAIKISYPNVQVVSLLNPSDVDNPNNQISSQLFFNHYYSLSDLAIVHGLRKISNPGNFKNFHSINTVIRTEILNIKPVLKNRKILCILGGGTVNVQNEFIESTLKIADLCLKLGLEFREYDINILCSSRNVYDIICERVDPNILSNVKVTSSIKLPSEYYSDCSLVITRAGRNSLSELLYLNIPTISFISGCSFRIEEQNSNAMYGLSANFKNLPTNIELSQFIKVCNDLLSIDHTYKIKNDFVPGNVDAIKLILNSLKIP